MRRLEKRSGNFLIKNLEKLKKIPSAGLIAYMYILPVIWQQQFGSACLLGAHEAALEQSQGVLLVLIGPINIGSVNITCDLVHLLAGAEIALRPRRWQRSHELHALLPCNLTPALKTQHTQLTHIESKKNPFLLLELNITAKKHYCVFTMLKKYYIQITKILMLLLT